MLYYIVHIFDFCFVFLALHVGFLWWGQDVKFKQYFPHCTLIWYYPHKGHDPLIDAFKWKVMILGDRTSENHRKFTERHHVFAYVLHISQVCQLAFNCVLIYSFFFAVPHFVCKVQPLPQNTVKTKHINTTPVCPFFPSPSSSSSVSHPGALKLS